jgi:hypothetical protein
MRILLFIFAIFLCVHVSAQRTRTISIVPDTAGKVISYGSKVEIRFYELFDNGKRKQLSAGSIGRLLDIKTVQPECQYVKGTVFFPRSTSNKELRGTKLKIKPLVSTIKLNEEVTVNMNFKDSLHIEFIGQGIMYSKQVESEPLIGFFELLFPAIFGDLLSGKGSEGGSGVDGMPLTVHIKKELDSIFRKEVFILDIAIDRDTTYHAIYRVMYPQKGINIISRGGEGGSGGDGEKGYAKDENRSEGAGSDGGAGGQGGAGGKITIILHPNASEIREYLNVLNPGGEGGLGGAGGAHGDTDDAFKYTGSNSRVNQGEFGRKGEHGHWGPNIEFRVEEF